MSDFYPSEPKLFLFFFCFFFFGFLSVFLFFFLSVLSCFGVSLRSFFFFFENGRLRNVRMSHLKKKEKKRKKRRDIGLGDASGEEPPRPSEGGAWNKSSGSLAVPGPQPPPTNKKQRTSAAVLSSHKTKSIAATVYCERCGSTTREDLRECSECQSSYCGACSELPLFKILV